MNLIPDVTFGQLIPAALALIGLIAGYAVMMHKVSGQTKSHDDLAATVAANKREAEARAASLQAAHDADVLNMVQHYVRRDELRQMFSDFEGNMARRLDDLKEIILSRTSRS